MSESEQSLESTDATSSARPEKVENISVDAALKRAELALERSIRSNITNRDKKLVSISIDAALAVSIVSWEYCMRKNIADAAWLEQLPLDPDLKVQIQARMNQNSSDWASLITDMTGLPKTF